MDSFAALVSVLGMFLTIGLAYYSIRTIALFGGSVAARAWVYTALSAIFLSIGLLTFLVNSIAPMDLFAFGSVLMIVGGVFLFLGLRKNFLFWASNDHFT